MLKLAEIIREGLKIKRARKEEPRRAEVPQENLKAESAVPVTPRDKIKAEPIPEVPLKEAAWKIKEEVESPLSLISKEMESLEWTVDEEEKVYRIGSLASLNFNGLEECNPAMSADKIKEAVKKTLLKKYDVEPEKLEKKLEDFKKKFRAFGTHCYIHALKQKIQPAKGEGEGGQ